MHQIVYRPTILLLFWVNWPELWRKMKLLGKNVLLHFTAPYEAYSSTQSVQSCQTNSGHTSYPSSFYLHFRAREKFHVTGFSVTADDLSFTRLNHDKSKQNGNVDFIWLLRIWSRQCGARFVHATVSNKIINLPFMLILISYLGTHHCNLYKAPNIQLFAYFFLTPVLPCLFKIPPFWCSCLVLSRASSRNKVAYHFPE